ncbi:MAG TPA: single-stranded-DNA-specific exonuclease RecJ, partial [Candidatus Limnocylindria bacterium]|nr:single-stranded-DNA-specific exonuclease RecJ [Candidatus Limnocylindria bacterium]
MPFTLPGYPDFLAGLLRARGVDSAEAAERFLHPDLSHLSDPTLLHGIPEAVAVIRRAVRSNARIAVYGDYDADGVCASAILLTALRGMGADAFSYIPDRVTEGYGLHAEAIRHLAGTAGLVVTVDCGVTAREEAALARELGLSLVITDHHTVPDMLPDADAVVHPAMGEHPEPGLCGAGVAWKLALALAGKEAALPLLELAALATVADLVPLLGENRVIAALGLRMMRDTARPGLRALKAVAGIKEGAPVTGEMAGFQLAPRLNAGGRLASAQLALDLLMAPDDITARPLAARLDMLNRERRDVEAAVLREAQAQIEGRDLTLTRTLVACGEGWNPGVVGLVAGRLAQRWNYPCVVLSQEGDVMHGSGRSAGDVDLHAALSECADLFHRFGGHRMAAGLSMPSSSLEAFRTRFDAAVRSQLGDGDL